MNVELQSIKIFLIPIFFSLGKFLLKCRFLRMCALLWRSCLCVRPFVEVMLCCVKILPLCKKVLSLFFSFIFFLPSCFWMIFMEMGIVKSSIVGVRLQPILILSCIYFQIQLYIYIVLQSQLFVFMFYVYYGLVTCSLIFR